MKTITNVLGIFLLMAMGLFPWVVLGFIIRIFVTLLLKVFRFIGDPYNGLLAPIRLSKSQL